MEDGWIEWAGGECPVPGATRIQIVFRCERDLSARSSDVDTAGALRWSHTGGAGDIVAYRVVQPAEDPEPDMVNSPPHYTQGGIETIDAIRAALTPEEFRGYCKGSVLAYVWRERHKGGDEDLGKSIWYLNQLLEQGS